jgi:hypothetical protein
MFFFNSLISLVFVSNYFFNLLLSTSYCLPYIDVIFEFISWASYAIITSFNCCISWSFIVNKFYKFFIVPS